MSFRILPYVLCGLIIFSVVNIRVVYAQDYDGGKSLLFQEYVPQLNINGGVQYQYDSNSFFPIMLWGGDDINQLQDIKDAGFNSFHTDVLSSKGNLRDISRNLGLKVFDYNPIPIISYAQNQNFDLENFYRNQYDPTRIGYYLFDELSTLMFGEEDGGLHDWRRDYGFTFWKDVYAKLRAGNDQAGPIRTVAWANFIGAVRNGCGFTKFTDMYSLDSYRLTSSTTGLDAFENDVKYYRGCGLNEGWRSPMMVIVQAWNDSGFWPTPEQLRVQVYASIVLGANGVSYFCQQNSWCSGIISKVGYPEHWAEVSKTNHEIDQYKYVWLSKTATDSYDVAFVPYIGAVYPIKTMLKTGGSKTKRYLLMVNFWNDPAFISDTAVNFPNLIAYKITSLLDNRNIAFTQNGTNLSFSDHLGGYAVRLYELDLAFPTPSPTPSPTSTPSPSYTILELKNLLKIYLGKFDEAYIPVDGKTNMMDAAWVIKWIQ